MTFMCVQWTGVATYMFTVGYLKHGRVLTVEDFCVTDTTGVLPLTSRVPAITLCSSDLRTNYESQFQPGNIAADDILATARITSSNSYTSRSQDALVTMLEGNRHITFTVRDFGGTIVTPTVNSVFAVKIRLQ
jgi:hypothetical protein